MGCHSTRPTLRAWPTSSFLKAVRFFASSCLGMSQILICQGRHGPREGLAGVTLAAHDPEPQNWQCSADSPGELSLYLPLTQWRGSWGPSERQALCQGPPAQAGAGDEPRPLVIFAILSDLRQWVSGWATGLIPRLDVRANLPLSLEYPSKYSALPPPGPKGSG